MLALEVAAGIVLAYIIIVNQKKLLSFAGQSISVLATVAVLGVMIWGAVAAWDWASNQFDPRDFRKLITLITLIPVFALATTGAIGMMMLVGLLFAKRPEVIWRALVHVVESTETKNENSGCGGMLALAFVAMLINYGLSYPVWRFTPIGEWYEAVDQWGRAAGWADSASVLFGALLWQWVWVPLGIYFLADRLRAKGGSGS